MKAPRTLRRTIRRWVHETSGQFAIMTALMMPVAITLAAFAVDAGSLYVEKREAQARVDLAAITAAANLHKPAQAALLTMQDNGAKSVVLAATNGSGQPVSAPAGDQIVVVPGQYRSDPAIPPADRFVANLAPHNAAKVTYRTTGTRFFAGALIPPPRIVVQGVARTSASATFSIGSRLLALKNEGLVNQLLGGLLGSSINLSLMDYNALLDANITLLGFLDALAIETGVTAGSYTQLLATDVTVGQIARALSNSTALPGTAKTAANRLAQRTGASNAPKLTVGDLIDPGGQLLEASIGQVGLDVGVMELIAASALAAGKGRQVALDLGAGVPGLLSTRVTLVVGEPPQHGGWFRIGSGGEVVRTAQTRLSLVAEIGGLLGVSIRIPLYLELAYGEATLRDVVCPGGLLENVKVTIDARPGAVNLYLAEVDPSKIIGFANPVARSPARLLHVPLLVSVTATAQAEIAEMAAKPLTFTRSDITNRKVRQVSTTQITGSLTQSLLSSLNPQVSALGGILTIGIPPNLSASVAQLVKAATPNLDAFLADLLSLLGLSIGEVDVRVHAATCGSAVLVQ